ncbi:uncharacterized protein YcsI (UPF0317 family) [Corynebacterium mucifaciens]
MSVPLLTSGDVRTDIPSYRVYAQGSLIDEPSDATTYWTDNTVAFPIGCSFTFEQALLDNGVPVAHIDCESAGVFSGKMVVSMRPIPAGLVADAVRITSRYPAVHGAPVHVGEPGLIGIDDLGAPDFGDAVDIPDGTVPVFWACGVTPQSIVMHRARCSSPTRGMRLTRFPNGCRCG